MLDRLATKQSIALLSDLENKNIIKWLKRLDELD